MFLRACLRALHRDPDRFLAVPAPVWPSPKPTGRPPGQEAGAPGAAGADGAGRVQG